MANRIPLRPHGNFGNFLYPTSPVSFGRNTKSRRSLISGGYARGSKSSHSGGKGVNVYCNLSWTPYSGRRAVAEWDSLACLIIV